MRFNTIIPAGFENYYKEWHYSPATKSNGFVFVSGCTGESSNGLVPEDSMEEYRQAFDSVGMVLTEAGLSYTDIIEMTTYHVGLKEQLEEFMRVKDEYLKEPYPAWTAIGVSELASDSRIEIKVVARGS